MKELLHSTCLVLIVLTAAPAAALDFAPAACAGTPFVDVPADHPYCPWIDQLGADQITGGCGGGNYCPDNPVTRAQLAMLLEKAMRGTASWDPWRGAYRRTLIVNPVLNGNPPQPDPLASGQRLVSLLAEIGDNAANNPYLLHLEPGLFDLGAGTLQLRPWVDVEGSGEGVTVIRGAGNFAVAQGADDVEVRSLTVEHVGGGGSAIAFDLAGDATRLTDVTAVVSGGTNFDHAIEMAGDGCMLTQVTAVATAPGGASAIAIYATGDAVLRQVTARAQGGAVSSGIVATTGSLLLEDVIAEARTSTFLSAVSLETGASATLRRVDASATTGLGGSTATALNLLDGDATVEGGTYVALAASAYGVRCSQLAGSHVTQIRNSRVAGLSHSIQGDAGCDVLVGDSQLAGGAVDPNGGQIVCFGTYDSNFANGALDACP